MIQILKKIWFYLTIPLIILNGILFSLCWLLTIRMSDFLDQNGLFNIQYASEDLRKYLSKKTELGNHLKYIYIIIILLIIYLHN
jgi:hypothetical protein